MNIVLLVVFKVNLVQAFRNSIAHHSIQYVLDNNPPNVYVLIAPQGNWFFPSYLNEKRSWLRSHIHTPVNGLYFNLEIWCFR